MWCHWHQHWHHIMPLALVWVTWYHYIGLSITSCEQHHQLPHCIPYIKIIKGDATWLLVMWCHWHQSWHHVMPSVVNGTAVFLVSRSLILSAKWPFSHLMPLALASVSHNTNSIINGTITFLRQKQLKWGTTWPFWSCVDTGVGISDTWC